MAPSTARPPASPMVDNQRVPARAEVLQLGNEEVAQDAWLGAAGVVLRDIEGMTAAEVGSGPGSSPIEEVGRIKPTSSRAGLIRLRRWAPG